MRLFEQRLNVSGLPAGAHLLVAVSGGADSMALLHALHERALRRRWRLTVAHLDHGIRGKASRDDATFVRKAARGLGIPCVIGRAPVPSLAKRAGISLEMAARQARYAFLARAARKTRADYVVTAHTADDQAETFFLKLLRGAGRGALGGIRETVPLSGLVDVKPAPTQAVVRPMLCVARRDVMDYLHKVGAAWREDLTNADPSFLRNRVRRELLPLLEKDYNPGIRGVVRRMSDVFSMEDAWMDEMARSLLEQCRTEERKGLDLARMTQFPGAARRRVIRIWMAECGITEPRVDYDTVVRVDAMCRRKTGSQVLDIGGGWWVARVYRVLLIRHGGEGAGFYVRLRASGVTVLPGVGLRVTVSVGRGILRQRGGRPGVYPAEATLDAGVWGGRELVVRSRRPGDRMEPYGMHGSRKVQDILVDAGVPRGERDRIPLVECGGEIVWIPGYRIARGWSVQGQGEKSLKLVVQRSDDLMETG